MAARRDIGGIVLWAARPSRVAKVLETKGIGIHDGGRPQSRRGEFTGRLGGPYSRSSDGSDTPDSTTPAIKSTSDDRAFFDSTGDWLGRHGHRLRGHAGESAPQGGHQGHEAGHYQ